MKNLVSMEERKNSCRRRTTLSTKDTEDLPRGDAIIRDHQVDAGTNLSALFGFVGGNFRVVKKPTLSDSYTVLLFSFSSSGLTTTSIKLIATSRFTEERLKSYPSKVKIVTDDTLHIHGATAAMVNKLVLFKQALPLDIKQKNQNVLVPQDNECHIKYIAVDQTANCNIVVFVTATMPIPCYLANENNQCDCRYVLSELSRRLCVKPSRELSQKLQYDCTAPPVCMRQRDTLHICMFCRKASVGAKQYGRICGDTFTKQTFGSRPLSRTVSKRKLKKKRKNTCGCCPRKRKGRDQSEAYVIKRTDDHCLENDETHIRRGNWGRPCFTGYNRCKPYPVYKPYPQTTAYSVCKPCPETTAYPECKHYHVCKPFHTESKHCCRPYDKCNSEGILRQECSAAKKGCIVSTEYCISDTQTELTIENTDLYLICQPYRLKSDNYVCNKYNRKRLEGKPETIHDHCKKQRDQVYCPRTDTCTNHLTRFSAFEKSLEGSTKSTTKQLSTEEEIKEISIESTESYLVPQRHNASDDKDTNLFIGRMEGSDFKTYPFRNQNNFVDRQYGIGESQKFPSVTSTNSNGSYLCGSVGQRRPKRSAFSKKLGFFKSFHFQQQRIVNSDPSTNYSSNGSGKFRPIRPDVLYSRNEKGEC